MRKAGPTPALPKSKRLGEGVRHLHRTAFPDTVRQDRCGAVQVRTGGAGVKGISHTLAERDSLYFFLCVTVLPPFAMRR